MKIARYVDLPCDCIQCYAWDKVTCTVEIIENFTCACSNQIMYLGGRDDTMSWEFYRNMSF